MKQHALTHKNSGIGSSPSRSNSNSNPNSDCDQPKTPNPMRPPSMGMHDLHDGGNSSDNSRPETSMPMPMPLSMPLPLPPSLNTLKRSPPESDVDTLPIAKRLQGKIDFILLLYLGFLNLIWLSSLAIYNVKILIRTLTFPNSIFETYL